MTIRGWALRQAGNLRYTIAEKSSALALRNVIESASRHLAIQIAENSLEYFITKRTLKILRRASERNALRIDTLTDCKLPDDLYEILEPRVAKCSKQLAESFVIADRHRMWVEAFAQPSPERRLFMVLRESAGAEAVLKAFEEKRSMSMPRHEGRRDHDD